jgi:hypothetical protein
VVLALAAAVAVATNPTPFNFLSEQVNASMSISKKNHAQLLLASIALVSTVSPDISYAEDVPEKGSIAIKYLDYLDRQPETDRIRVKASAISLLAPISAEWSIGSTITTDGISGASPRYHNAGITNMIDRRNAVDAVATRYFSNGTLSLGSSYSHESDYLSKGLSVQGTLSSENRNTTWLAGIGVSNDTINPNNKIVEDEKKHVKDFMLGVSQTLTPNDIVQFNLGYSSAQGYLSDPYKVFDNRPDRNSRTVTVRWNHHITETGGTTRLNYRYFADSWSIRSHTVGLEYVQPLSQGWTITPLLRLYSQSAAEFYVDAGPIDFPFPPNPPQGAQYFSEDQRLSAFGAHTYGLKIEKQLGEDWVADIKFEKYEQRSSWKISGGGSPGLLPFYARSIQLGLSHSF